MLSHFVAVSLFAPFTFGLANGEKNAAALREVADAYGSIDEKGRRVINYAQVPEELRNPWSTEREEAFITHYQQYLDYVQKSPKTGVNTYFENEKYTYGKVMLTRLVGHEKATLKALQAEDNQAGVFHKETKGIDYYASFTIKHQMRKYFWFGEELDPKYRQRMFDGAKAWTEKDPLHRPHYSFNPAKRNQGWTPEARNSWVDVRGTDNLQAMRETSVYLMAEETGNEETRKIYHKRIKRFVQSLYRTGNGEWDSHNYLGHTVAPYHTLYDFTKDREVRLLAKAALDWFYTAAALKYWRGNWNGPSRRDYNAITPQQGSAPITFGIHFGALSPEVAMPRKLDADEVNVITSAYRPPEAVMRLAERRFSRPLELWGVRPHYDSAVKGRWDRDPMNHETQYYANSFQFGTLRKGTHGGDINGFKLLIYSQEQGSEMIQVVPGPDALSAGSAVYKKGKVIGSGRVGQFNNSAVYLVKHEGATPWRWVLPNTVKSENVDGVTFLEGEKTWIAIRPIGQRINGLHEEETERIRINKKEIRYNARHHPKITEDQLFINKKGKTVFLREDDRYPNYWAMGATGAADGLYDGFAIEIGEAESHGDYVAFKQQVLGQQKLDVSQLSAGIVVFTDSHGQELSLDHAGDFRRNGEVRNYAAPWSNWRPANGGDIPVRQDWLSGRLRVEVDGAVFTSSVDDDGKVIFSNELKD